MPRRDGTGPTGAGPMTGRRMGPCNVSSAPRSAGAGIQRNTANISQTRGQSQFVPRSVGRGRGGAVGRGPGRGKGRGRGRSGR